LVLAGAGVTAGLLGAFGLTRLMTNLLFGVSAMDPLTYGSVATGVTVVALLACYLPARRAAGMNPVDALTE
jgi:putative ABC transport system permease protein